MLLGTFTSSDTLDRINIDRDIEDVCTCVCVYSVSEEKYIMHNLLYIIYVHSILEEVNICICLCMFIPTYSSKTIYSLETLQT